MPTGVTGFTTRNVPYFDDTLQANQIGDGIVALTTWINAHPGVSVETTTSRNALAGADLWDGRIIWNQTTLQLEKYDAGSATWIAATTSVTLASTVTGPDTPGTAAVAAVVGTSSAVARADHDHGFPQFVGTATPPAQAFGDAGTAGTTTVAARRDHKHPMMAVPTTVVGPDTPGTSAVAAVVGTSASPALADHDHGLPQFFDATAPVTQAFGDAAAVGSSAHVARRDHKHGMPAAPAQAVSQITNSVLGSAAASITFSSIPGTFNHLTLMGVGRSARAGTGVDNWAIQVNGDTTNGDYVNSGPSANGSSTGGGATVGAEWCQTAQADLPGATATATAAGQFSIVIPAYALTTFQKAMQWNAGMIDSPNAQYRASVGTGSWLSTAAVTSLKIFSVNAANLVTGTACYLYGET